METREHPETTAPGLLGFWFQGLSLLVFYLLFYGSAVPALVRDWYENSTFSYGFLISFFFGILVWSKRSLLKTIPIRPSGWGLPLLAVALAVGLAGEGISDTFTMRLSMLVALAALVLLLMGRRQFNALRFPLLYLFLMIPWPYSFLKPIIDHLRLSDAAVSAFALNAIGISVTREAYFLYLPRITLEVADVCSGAGSVFALVAVAGIHACFLPVRPGLQLLLIAGAVPFAVIANLIRIILTSILAYFFGLVVFQTPLHHLSGTATFLLGLALLIVLGEILRRQTFGSESRLGDHRAEELPVRQSRPLNTWFVFLSAAGFFLLAFHFAGSLEAQSAVPMKAQLQELPAHLGPYAPSQSEWADSYQDDKASHSVLRIYETEDRSPIELFVGYRGRQRGEDRLRSPRMFFADDWNYVRDEPVRLPVPGGAAIDGRLILISTATTRRLVLYWYETQSRSFSSELAYRLSLIRSSLVDRRSDGAVIRIATGVSEKESIERAKERIRKFALVLYPELRAILPD